MRVQHGKNYLPQKSVHEEDFSLNQKLTAQEEKRLRANLRINHTNLGHHSNHPLAKNTSSNWRKHVYRTCSSAAASRCVRPSTPFWTDLPARLRTDRVRKHHGNGSVCYAGVRQIRPCLLPTACSLRSAASCRCEFASHVLEPLSKLTLKFLSMVVNQSWKSSKKKNSNV